MKREQLPAGVFRITIDDGFCEWYVEYKLSGQESIKTVEEKIRKGLKCKPAELKPKGNK